MNSPFRGWGSVADELEKLAKNGEIELFEGQKASLIAVAERFPQNGVIIADEVGMGKTRIAAAVAGSVIAAGGRVAILVPPGLGYQWGDELRSVGVSAPPILRSLGQYLDAWKCKESPAPWFNEAALVVSHAFTNWRLGETAAWWRWALLPEVYAKWRAHENGRFPRDYHDNQKLSDERIKNAAQSIVEKCASSNPQRKLIQLLAEQTSWPGALDAAEYMLDATLRPWLECAVGLGLGVFDLVIIDEAHKSRGHDSGLNRLLAEVVLLSENARCLAMTATPVELDASQWTQMLERIRVDESAKEKANTEIQNYSNAVSKVRQCPSNEKVRENYVKAAKDFNRALAPYLLRRDKREDSAVIEFQQHSGENYHAYRREREILVDTAQLNPEWQQAVCAAEALSFVTRQSDQALAKRVRLTLGNGHGIAALMDQLHRDELEDQKQIEADGVSLSKTQVSLDSQSPVDKRLQRAEWWQKVMTQPFEKDEGLTLLDHPAILAAVKRIETVCQQGGKVLVFGRFTRPLRALVDLLNARELLRCIDEKRPWPQSIAHSSEWKALEAAHRQRDGQGKLDLTSLNNSLKDQYSKIENQRCSFRNNLIKNIEIGFNVQQPEKSVRALFDAFKKKVKEDSEHAQIHNDHNLAVVARAIQEIVGVDAAPVDIAQSFIALVAAASARNEGDTDVDEQLNKTKASSLWAEISIQLHEEYSRPEGGFARLMYGDTKPATRRFLQLAFNRTRGHPKVLVAQSLVGREGLNLHKACRTVVLLHPEWNPGVVEQQIGRVDRIGSLWAEKLCEAIADKKFNDDLPRIEIHSVVFRGTYDEKNWQVLHDRWDDLRAQLHGVVISPRIAQQYSDAEIMFAEINNAAPNFSPSGITCAEEKT